ncbi:MAG: flavodoxin domain-containing protein [Bacteroides sp.]
MKTAIIFYSKHHENTKKLLDAIKSDSSDDITLVDVTSTDSVKLDEYDTIGFASGIYYSKFDKRVLKFAKENLPNGKNVFFIYTCGSEKGGYTSSIREAVAGKNAKILGEYGCLGFDTFGPFKLIGGIAKNHPDEADKKGAVDFYNSLNK